MVSVTSIGGTGGDTVELAGEYAPRNAHTGFIQRSQHVGQPGRVIHQTMCSAEVRQVLATGLLEDTRQCTGDVEVVTVIPKQTDAFFTGGHFQRRDRWCRRVIDDQQFTGEIAGVEGGQISLDDRSRP